MNATKEYKCPCCGGAISFDVQSQNLKCPYCDTEFDIEALNDLDDEARNAEVTPIWETEGRGGWQEGEAENLCTYLCESCGGEIVTDNTTCATSCPFCDNPVILTGKISNDLRPDLVIPFKFDKQSAKKALKDHFKGKKLLPKAFASEAHLDEIKGVYVPFWLFSANTESKTKYKGARVSMWSDSEYIYTKTKYFSLIRGGNLNFSHIPVDGSTKMANDVMESLEPYDISEAVDFETAYLAGYFADRYDVSSEESIVRANERIRQSIIDEFRKTTLGYSETHCTKCNFDFIKSSVKYALLPVWLLTTSYKDKNYTFAMNGQTGKFVGNLPMDIGAFWRWFFAIFGIVAAISFLILLWASK